MSKGFNGVPPLNGAMDLSKTQIHWRDVPPTEGKFCPFQPAQIFPQREGAKSILVRVLHPCLTSCALWNARNEKCNLAPVE